MMMVVSGMVRSPALSWSTGIFAAGQRSRKAVAEPGSARARVIEKINALRNYAAGAFVDAARNEWASLIERWRMAMLLLAGVGGDEELPVLAAQSWRKLADHQQESLRSACVVGLHHLGRANALAGTA